MKKLDKLLVQNVDRALALTEKFKEYLSSPAAIALTALIPGDLDDKIREKMVQGLNLALAYLGWIKDGREIARSTLEDYKAWLSEQPKAVQDAHLHKIASYVAKTLDGRYSDTHLYDTAVQLHYTLNK